MARRVLLIGGGHAHLYVLKRAAEFRSLNAEVTVVDPGTFWYSGLATGVLGGQYPPERDQIDIESLARGTGAGFVRGRVTAMEPTKKLAELDDGSSLEYDAASINIGSESPAPFDTSGLNNAWGVKPISNLWKLHQALAERIEGAAGKTIEVAVVGGGATGCELAANLTALGRHLNGAVRVHLIVRGERLLRRHSAGAGRQLLWLLKKRGVEVHFNTEAEGVAQGWLRMKNGAELSWDFLVWATGLRPPGWLRSFNLELLADGGVLVNRHMQSVTAPEVFAAGDCIAFQGKPLPRIGVFGVRASPVIHENLKRTLQGRELVEFEPQKRWLLILNLGLGQGLALWDQYHWLGRLSLRWKHYLDESFLAQYR